MDKKMIVTVSLPRSLSTALFKSFESREDFIAKQEGGLRPYNQKLLDTAKDEATDFYKYMLRILPEYYPTYDALVEDIESTIKTSGKHLFIKEMCFCREYLTAKIFQDATFFALVRRPENMLISFYKESKLPMTESIGKSLDYLSMIDFIDQMQSMGRKVNIIRSEDLENEPGKTIENMCLQSGINYEPSQLSWEPLPLDATESKAKGSTMLPGWHNIAKTSSGFNKNLVHPVDKDANDIPTFNEIPPEYREGYIEFWHKQIPNYQTLCNPVEHKRRISSKY